jgi:hypothetical protein
MKYACVILSLILFMPSARAGGCPKLDHLCKDVKLVPPENGRLVAIMSGGVKMTFGLEAFKKAAKERRDEKLIEWLDKKTAKEIQIPLAKMPSAFLHNAVIFAAAKLLEQGKAQLYDTKKKQKATRVIVQQWDWIGCGGGCRQSGREFRLAVPGQPFFRTTDLYEDGEEGTF